MAHIAERMMSHYQAIILGYAVFCCPDANRLPAFLKEVHPEIVFGGTVTRCNVETGKTEWEVADQYPNWGGTLTTAGGLVFYGAFLIEERTPEEIFTPEDFTEEHRAIARTTEEFFAKEVAPNLDAIQEFKTEENSMSAEFGRSGGAVMNVTFKSGTNQFHGSLREFYRGENFAANTFFNNRNGVERPALHRSGGVEV